MEQTEGNREIILQCGLKLFSLKGYDPAGVQEIAEAAGIKKPTLYHYFGSKRGLLDAIINEYGGKLIDMISAEAEYKHDIVNNLNRLAFALINFAMENRVFYRMQLAMYFSPPESEVNAAVREMNLKIYSLFEKLFVKAAEDHGNMKGRHKAYAATFIGMVNTYISLSIDGLVSLKNDSIYKAVHQFMHGIFS